MSASAPARAEDPPPSPLPESAKTGGMEFIELTPIAFTQLRISLFPWIAAASVKASLSRARFGFLGNNYSGMLDMYSDFTMLQGATGMHVEILEMCDLAKHLSSVSDEDAARKPDEI